MTGDLGGTEEKVVSRCVVTIEICQNDGSILENIIYGCHVLIKGRYRRACGVMVLSLIRQIICIHKKIHEGTFVNSFQDKSINLFLQHYGKISHTDLTAGMRSKIYICNRTHYNFEVLFVAQANCFQHSCLYEETDISIVIRIIVSLLERNQIHVPELDSKR